MKDINQKTFNQMLNSGDFIFDGYCFLDEIEIKLSDISYLKINNSVFKKGFKFFQNYNVQELDLMNNTFNSDVEISTNIIKNIWLNSSIYNKKLIFSNNEILESFYVIDVKFLEDHLLALSEINGNKFSGIAAFTNCEFKCSLRMMQNTYYNCGIFNKNKFYSDLQIDSDILYNKNSFESCYFDVNTSFDIKDSEIFNKNSEHFGGYIFKKIVFNPEKTKFSNISFKDGDSDKVVLEFEDCTLSKVRFTKINLSLIDINDCLLDESYIDESFFKENSGIPIILSKNQIHTAMNIKKAYDRTTDYISASKFFFKEMDLRTKKKDVSIWKNFMNSDLGLLRIHGILKFGVSPSWIMLIVLLIIILHSLSIFFIQSNFNLVALISSFVESLKILNPTYESVMYKNSSTEMYKNFIFLFNLLYRILVVYLLTSFIISFRRLVKRF